MISAIPAVISALSRSLILHAPHPDFGGVLTAGPYRTADGHSGFATIAHGCSDDVGDAWLDDVGDADARACCARSFEFQVGPRAARNAAEAALSRGAS